jgi:hypothetical protein
MRWKVLTAHRQLHSVNRSHHRGLPLMVSRTQNYSLSMKAAMLSRIFHFVQGSALLSENSATADKMSVLETAPWIGVVKNCRCMVDD